VLNATSPKSGKKIGNTEIIGAKEERWRWEENCLDSFLVFIRLLKSKSMI
jgi:hypothetical protein